MFAIYSLSNLLRVMKFTSILLLTYLNFKVGDDDALRVTTTIIQGVAYEKEKRKKIVKKDWSCRASIKWIFISCCML